MLPLEQNKSEDWEEAYMQVDTQSGPISDFKEWLLSKQISIKQLQELP